jgi:phosphoribosylanthranilate isomerase
MYNPRVKICCISSPEEAALAIKHGAAALGLVGQMPSGPGIIDNDLIRSIVKTIPPPISSFLLTSETSARNIIDHYQKVQTTTIQIVDALSDRQYQLIRQELPNVKLVQVIHVLNEASIEEAIEISEFVDAVLLDSGNPNLLVKELGGTGRIHDWRLSRQIREAINVPMFLAGGINNDNVRQAVELVQPFGLDLCSSVRTNGLLDERKLEVFFTEIEKIGR